MTIAAAFRPIADASISIASAYRPIAVELLYSVKIRDIDIELCESTLLTVVHPYL